MKNIMGVVLCFIYVYLSLYVPRFFVRFSDESRRKIGHILVGNWWIINLLLIDNLAASLIVPVLFIIIAYYSVKRNTDGGLVSSLERKNDKKTNGVILYPISMSIILVISYLVFNDVRVGGIGMFALSYGDGFASLIGSKYKIFPIKIFGNVKSLSGCLAMFIATFISVGIYMYFITLMNSIIHCAIVSLCIALFATIAELFTPRGYDNITIPIVSFLVYGIMV